jgi:hypothetical protein
MFDFHRWASWASQQAATSRQEGLQASFTFTEESRASDNPAFFVDIDTEGNIGRIVVWSTGAFDLSVHQDLAEKAQAIPDLPSEATDQTFQALFDRFVALAKG